MKYPNTIKERRFEKKVYFQKDMASTLGVNRAVVSKWEAGDTFPNYQNLIKLTNYLACTVKDLYPEQPVAK